MSSANEKRINVLNWQYIGNAYQQKAQDETASRFEEGAMGWIYIETDYCYETTIRKLCACWKKVKAGESFPDMTIRWVIL